MHFALLNSVSNPAVGVRPFTFRDMQVSVQRIAAHGILILGALGDDIDGLM